MLQPIELVDHSGKIIPATVTVSEEGDDIRVQLEWAGREIAATDSDAFSALCTLRVQLWEIGLVPCCYGACRNLVVSAMAAQMGCGLKGYLVQLGRQSRMSGLVQIFDAGPDMELVTPSEQHEFKLEWLRSLGLPT